MENMYLAHQMLGQLLHQLPVPSSSASSAETYSEVLLLQQLQPDSLQQLPQQLPCLASVLQQLDWQVPQQLLPCHSSSALW